MEAGSLNIGSLQDSEDGDQNGNQNSGRRLQQDVTVDPQASCSLLLYPTSLQALLLRCSLMQSNAALHGSRHTALPHCALCSLCLHFSPLPGSLRCC